MEVEGRLYPAVQFLRNRNADGVSIQVRAATGVTFVQLQPVTMLPPVDLGNGQERVLVRGQTPLDQVNAFFFQVYVGWQ